MSIGGRKTVLDKTLGNLITIWATDSFGANIQRHIGATDPFANYRLNDSYNDRFDGHDFNDIYTNGTTPEYQLNDSYNDRFDSYNFRHDYGSGGTPDPAIAAAEARGKELPRQFAPDYDYTARRGETFDLTEDIVREVASSISSWVGDKLNIGALQEGGAINNAIEGTKRNNRKVLQENLALRWRTNGAAGELLKGSALRAPLEKGVRRDSDTTYTVAGFQDPQFNFNVDNWTDGDYKLRFMNGMLAGTEGQNSGLVYPPDNKTMTSAARAGSNLGQIAPFPTSGGTSRFGVDKYKKASSDFQRYVKNLTGEVENSHGTQKLNTLRSEILVMQERYVRNIGPGGRVPLVFNVRVNLTDLLRQNILIPPHVVRQDQNFVGEDNLYRTAGELSIATVETIGNSAGAQELTDGSKRTFAQMYLKNANPVAGKVGVSSKEPYRDDRGNIINPAAVRRPGGAIAGVPVADLQSPLLLKSSGTYKPQDDYAVIDFKDDAERLTLDKAQRGFTDNIAGNIEEGGLDTAVKIAVTDENNINTSILEGDAQYFPFMFETINKSGASRNGKDYKEFAFFQATLNSISESYSPTWSSKHFFGRTEQVHTYSMTDRSIDFSFGIVVNEVRLLQNLYERVLWLGQQTYGSYDENGLLKGGALLKLTIGDMFAGLNGFIRSLSYDWNYLGAGGKWEMSKGLRIPMGCTVNCNFAVMHERMPDRNTNFYPGPMRHPQGLNGGSERGAQPDQPWKDGGYLITEDGRKMVPASAGTGGQDARGRADTVLIDEDLDPRDTLYGRVVAVDESETTMFKQGYDIITPNHRSQMWLNRAEYDVTAQTFGGREKIFDAMDRVVTESDSRTITEIE